MGSVDIHCGRPRAHLNAFRGCAVCGRLFAPAERGGHELTGPIGVRVRLLEGGGAELGSYRSSAQSETTTLCLERAWRVRWALPLAGATFATCFLAFWGGTVTAAALGLLGGTLHVPVPAALVMGLFVLTLSAAAGYLSVSLALNRTRIVVTERHVSRSEGPVARGWRTPLTVERSGRDQVLAVKARGNDLRNLGARWPAPEHHQVELHRGGGDAVVLIEQIHTSRFAEEIRQLVDDLLAATRRA